MCGRLSIAVPQEQLEARFEANAAGSIETRYNAYPNHDRYPLPVITTPEPDRITLRWGGMMPLPLDIHQPLNVNSSRVMHVF